MKNDKILVLDQCEELRRRIEEELQDTATVLAFGTVSEAREALAKHPDIALVAIGSADLLAGEYGSARLVADIAKQQPDVTLVCMSNNETERAVLCGSGCSFDYPFYDREQISFMHGDSLIGLIRGFLEKQPV